MRSIARALQVAAVLAAGVVLVSTAVKSQAPARAASGGWEYASVIEGVGSDYVQGPDVDYSHNSYKFAHICYATSSGCLVHTVVSSFDLQDNANQADGILKAASDLGAQGWEMVSAGVFPNSNERLYFRRQKPGR